MLEHPHKEPVSAGLDVDSGERALDAAGLALPAFGGVGRSDDDGRVIDGIGGVEDG